MATQAYDPRPVDTHELITPSPTMFNGTDALALRSGDAVVLVGRLLLGWLFLKGGWDKLMNIPGFAGYLTSLKVPAPTFMAYLSMLGELAIGLALIFGIATRYLSLFAFVYLIITIVLAHRYWDYPPAQQMAQFNNFLKNLSIMGGSLLLFVTGAGRFSIDGWLRRSRR